MSPGDFVKHLTVYKTPWEKLSREDQKSYLPYVINLWLAMCPELIEIINEIQSQQVPNRDHYNLYLKLLPKKSLRFQWIKAKKKEYSKDVINKLSQFFSVGSREIYDSIHILSELQIKTILSNMGIPEKEINKLIKN